MNTYSITGTIRFGSYCDCSDCRGHFNNKEVDGYIVQAKDEFSALDGVLDVILEKEIYDESEWKGGAVATLLEADIPESDSEFLLPTTPEKLLKKVAEKGLLNYWK